MKKLLLLALLLIMIGCTRESVHDFPLDVGDTKTYETREYIIIYEVTGFNRYNRAIWGFKEIKVKKQLCQDTMKT